MTFEKANDEREDTVKKHTPKIRVEDLKRLSVFEVPQDYFLHLPAHIQARLAKDRKWPQSTPFLVPEEYFAQLPHEIEARLRPSSSALPEKAKVPFVVPGDFFADLSEAIAQKIAAQETPKELPISAQTGPDFYLPEAYFETLPGQIDQKIRANVHKEHPQAPLRPVMYLAFALLGIFLVYKGISWLSVKNNLGSKPALVQEEEQQTPNRPQIPEKGETEEETRKAMPQNEREMPVASERILQKLPVPDSKAPDSVNTASSLAIEGVNKEELLAYLENSPLSEDEILEIIWETEPAAAEILLDDWLLREEDLGPLEDTLDLETLEFLERAIRNKP